jgi:AraC-like DNA-binding protein
MDGLPSVGHWMHRPAKSVCPIRPSPKASPHDRCSTDAISQHFASQVAAQPLDRHATSIAQVAVVVGYESEAAFNRAFKKQVGVPPGSRRRSPMKASRDLNFGAWENRSTIGDGRFAFT